MNVLADLVAGDPNACTSYLKDRPEAGLATCTIICRAKTREENLDLPTLVNQEVQRVGSYDEEHIHSHVVTSVLYGAEVYCVFAQVFNEDENDNEARQEIVENLSKLAGKWRDALYEFQDLIEFTKSFDSHEKHSIARIKCRLYADLQTEPVLYCDFYDSYKHSLALMKKIFSIPEPAERSKTNQIAVQFCPLEVLFDPAGRVEKKVKYFDDRLLFVKPFSRIFAELSRAIARAEEMSKDNTKFAAVSDDLGKFTSLVIKYQQFLQTEFKGRIRHFHSVIRFIDELKHAAKTHPHFKSAQLEEWLDCKEAELDMIGSMTSKALGNGINFVSYNYELGDASPNPTDKISSLILFVPPMDSGTNPFLQSMETSIDKPESLFNNNQWEVVDATKPWHFFLKKRKIVLNKIQEMARFAEKNKGILHQVRFTVSHHSRNSNIMKCRYTVYDCVTRLSYNVHRLPDPPTGLRIRLPAATRGAKRAKMLMTSIRVEWNYEDLGFPCTFLVEYRRKGSSGLWIQRRTTMPDEMQLTVSFKTGLMLEFRVAAETCIGRGEPSQVVDMESAAEDEDEEDQQFQTIQKKGEEIALLPPIGLRVKSTTRYSVELEWSSPSTICNDFFFRVDYWQEGEDYINRKWETFQCGEPSYLLGGLQAEKTYLCTISTTTEDGSTWSAPSDAVVFVTTAVRYRFAETLMKCSKKISNETGMNVYAVPLEEQKGRLLRNEHFVFGEADGDRDRHKHRTILFVGDSSSGKTALINALINYVLDVNLEDPFRFQLIDPSKDDNQSGVTVYDINFVKGMRIDYSLTIIDTPNYVEGQPVKNVEITKTIDKFFDVKNGIQQVNMVGFAVDSKSPNLMPIHFYIYCSLMTIFGNKIKENVYYLFNYDNHQKPLIRAITEAGLVHQHFNSSTSTPVLRPMKNFQKFFLSLAGTNNKVSSVSKQVLDEKKRLKATVGVMAERMETNMSEFRELRKTKKRLKYFWNYSNDFQVKKTLAQRRILPLGQYVANCPKCQITCDAFDCDVMERSVPGETRICHVCPGKCSWNEHEIESFKWFYFQEDQWMKSDDLKIKYETKLKKTLDRREVIQAMNVDIGASKKNLLELIHSILRCISRLNKIAGRLNGNSKMHCRKIRQRIAEVTGQLKMADIRDRWLDFAQRITALILLEEAVNNDEVESFGSEEFWSFQENSLQFFNVNADQEIETEQEDADLELNDESEDD